MYNEVAKAMLEENIKRVRARIEAACARVKRDPAEVTLVAVSKGRTSDEINEVLAAGCSEIGENRVQEAIFQLSAISFQLSAVKWHMIGHLQTNKVKDAVRIFELIHSVDSLKLAAEIDKQAARINKAQDILLEVKVSPEATKSGVSPDEAERLVVEITQFKNLSLKGLMTIAPLAVNPEDARPYFRLLRELSSKISGPRILSMGMSDDFEVAIEEGATIVRIGRAIFEANK